MRPRPAAVRGRGRPALLAGLLAGVAVALLVGWWLWPGSSATAQAVNAVPPAGLANTGQAGPAASVGAPASAPGGPPLSAAGLAQRAEQRALALARLQRAQAALAAYQQAARYPHDSRPIEEHPDQSRPFAPIEEEHGLRLPGGGAPTQGVRLRTTQERVFAAGLESNRVTLTLLDDQGRPLPLRITRAVMQEVTPPGARPSTTAVALPVADNGQAGDVAAGDGIFTAVMQPGAQGFARYAGLVRLALDLEYAGQPGFIYFDLVYSPAEAARWRPGVREAMVNGSLEFQLPVEVLVPGRYVASGRIDDANGQPLALASFNAELPTGPALIRLPVFGRLVRDRQPLLPLQLRDVEAFLLRPDAYPDRTMLPRLAGVVQRSAVMSPAGFSDAEWTSEERSRYLDELGRDVASAEQQLARLPPAE